ncbi:MAG: DUF4010 domain-containing protein [Gemmatimonadota bacterium]|nr:DUF4010 domain-containing protein [Gemmatimonadota bacterium]MDH4348052.1 DUF4010 domain-containing protein [Gemmatimonadota bacterium]MDH5283688.1 DUF4010 domain-containing protein [Gemmatimonadota bacterium]
MSEAFSPLGLVIAGLVGLAVGIEREWSGHASGPAARFAGARTFFLIGLAGGLAGLLGAAGLALPATAILLGVAALAVAAYVTAARRGGDDAADGTTEAAALVVLGLGAVAGLGEARLAAAAGAVVVLVLREKSTIHGFVRRLGEAELRGGLQFAVLALVFLPILPVGPYGPLGGVRPRSLWGVVLLVSGLSYAGFIARRAIGPTRGPALAGILGGIVSSTAVTLQSSRESRLDHSSHDALAVGVIGACAALLPRITIVTLALRPSVALPLAGALLPAFVAGALMVWWRWGAGETPAASPALKSPLRLGSALLLAAGFQIILMLLVLVHREFGDQGVLPTAAFLGLTDMDALTYSMARLAAEGLSTPIVVSALAVGVLSNTLFKLITVLTLGVGRFRRLAAGGLLLQALALAGVLLVEWLA